jgi:predicted transcriptional regulator
MESPRSRGSQGRAEDVLSARLLVDEEAREVLGVFLGRSRSAQEAASELGRPLDAVLYRVKRLLAAGLLVMVDQRLRGGRPIKVYRSTFDSWFVPFEALPYADVEEALRAIHVANAERIARAEARHLTRTPFAGFCIERRGDGRIWMYGSSGEIPSAAAVVPRGGLGHGAADWTVDLHLSAADARALNEALIALVERFMARSAGPSETPNRLLVVASVPLEEE